MTAVLAVVATSACGRPAVAKFSQTATNVPDRGARSVEAVEVYMAPDEPRCKYHYVGLYEAEPETNFLGGGDSDPKTSRRDEEGRRRARLRRDRRSEMRSDRHRRLWALRRQGVRMRLTLCAVGLVLVTSAGCYKPPQVAMTPSTEPMPARAQSSSTATILFLSDLRHSTFISGPVTIYDEDRHFYGELTMRSAFAVEVPPGKHRFVGAIPSNNERLFFCRRFAADLAPGKIYVAQMIWRDIEGTKESNFLYRTTLLMPSYAWLFPHPGARVGDSAIDVKAYEMTAPDVSRGQDMIDNGPFHQNLPSAKDDGPCEGDRSGYGRMADEVGKTATLPADWGFDELPTL